MTSFWWWRHDNAQCWVIYWRYTIDLLSSGWLRAKTFLLWQRCNRAFHCCLRCNRAFHCCLQGQLCGLCLWVWPSGKMRMILRIKMTLQKWHCKNEAAKMTLQKCRNCHHDVADSVVLCASIYWFRDMKFNYRFPDFFTSRPTGSPGQLGEFPSGQSQGRLLVTWSRQSKLSCDWLEGDSPSQPGPVNSQSAWN